MTFQADISGPMHFAPFCVFLETPIQGLPARPASPQGALGQGPVKRTHFLTFTLCNPVGGGERAHHREATLVVLFNRRGHGPKAPHETWNLQVTGDMDIYKRRFRSPVGLGGSRPYRQIGPEAPDYPIPCRSPRQALLSG